MRQGTKALVNVKISLKSAPRSFVHHFLRQSVSNTFKCNAEDEMDDDEGAAVAAEDCRCVHSIL